MATIGEFQALLDRAEGTNVEFKSDTSTSMLLAMTRNRPSNCRQDYAAAGEGTMADAIMPRYWHARAWGRPARIVERGASIVVLTNR